MSTTLIDEINVIVNVLRKETEEARTDKTRLIAIAITHLETARLFLKEAGKE